MVAVVVAGTVLQRGSGSLGQKEAGVQQGSSAGGRVCSAPGHVDSHVSEASLRVPRSSACERILRAPSPAGFGHREDLRMPPGPPRSNPSDSFVRPPALVESNPTEFPPRPPAAPAKNPSENRLRLPGRPGSNTSDNSLRPAAPQMMSSSEMSARSPQGLTANENPLGAAHPPGSIPPEDSLRGPLSSNSRQTTVGALDLMGGLQGSASREAISRAPRCGNNGCEGLVRAQVPTQSQAECMNATDDVGQDRTGTLATASRGGDSVHTDASSPQHSAVNQRARAPASVRLPSTLAKVESYPLRVRKTI